MPFEKQCRKIRNQKRRRTKWRRRFFRELRRNRRREIQRKTAVLFILAVSYLFLVQKENNRIWSVKEEYTAEFCLPVEKQKQEIFRVVFRLKTGELLFFHERSDLVSEDPEN